MTLKMLMDVKYFLMRFCLLFISEFVLFIKDPILMDRLRRSTIVLSYENKISICRTYTYMYIKYVFFTFCSQNQAYNALSSNQN